MQIIKLRITDYELKIRNSQSIIIRRFKIHQQISTFPEGNYPLSILKLSIINYPLPLRYEDKNPEEKQG